MALVKIAFATILLVLIIACNGYGLRSISRMSVDSECHDSKKCNLMLAHCKSRVVCENGSCTCVKINALTKTQCDTNSDCWTLCPPICDLAHCDMKTHTCDCACQE